MRNKVTSLAAFTFSHFCVDFACIFMLYSQFSLGMESHQVSLGFLLYSVIAFGSQLFIGVICDKRPRFPAGVLGCALVIAGLSLHSFAWGALALCAAGNALFHVDGGIDSLVHSGGKIARSGIFVSTGAVGVALGALLGQSGMAHMALPVVLLCVSIVMILLFRINDDIRNVDFKTDGDTPCRAFNAVMALLFVAIMIRSLGGFIAPMPWKTQYLLLPAIGACAGKALGGFIADGWGARKTGAVSLIAGIPLLCFGWQTPWAGFLGLVLFNMNMPITLCAVSDRLRGNPGLAFGVTTLALLCGAILPFLYVMPSAIALAVLPVLCALSALFIWLTVSDRPKAAPGAGSDPSVYSRLKQ